ncbi:hypothetical protein F4820DRAFT_445522 [Hypoxylon rubiginosum]|uniref:Uncharacterized protein n=1 Tax=Hypoxylon rubiginosum TaxID=110542 RepID=A0ACB9Z8K5_9PEZI|nr:hypothetical protein F4820DRAFT_445522 [Hypoxylon rubiginosum]
MGILTKTLVLGLLAMYHGLAIGAVLKVVNKQESVQDSTLQVECPPVTTVGTVSESIVVSPISQYPYTFATTYSDASHRIRTTQGIDLVGPVPSQSSTLSPTRAGEDTSHPTPNCGASQTGMPHSYGGTKDYQDFLDSGYDGTRMSPRDDYDGYGYGSGSGTTPAANGGYGSPPGTTDLPPGGYGNPPPPAIDKPSVATVTDPVTVTVSLETPTVVTVTVTSTSASQVPVQNVTLTVTESSSTFPLHPVVTVFTTSTGTQQSITPQVPADDPSPSSAGVVYTTVTMPSSTVTSTTTHAPPKPVTDTNAAESTAKLNYCLLFIAAALAAMGPSVSSLIGGLAFLIASNDDTKVENNNAAGVGGNHGSATGCEAQCASHQRGLSEASSHGCCGHKLLQRPATTGLEPKAEAEKYAG